MQMLRWCLPLLVSVVVPAAAHAADAVNGQRIATTHCTSCHVVLPGRSDEVAQAPPFEVIARKFALTPQVLAFWILDPHPRMNLTLTRRDAEDIAAYINTLAK